MSLASKRTWPQAVLLAVLVLAAYGPAYQAGLVIDDDNYVTENELLRSTDGLRRIWLEPSATPQYYPLVFTDFWVDYQMWGPDPTGYHVGNVLLHAINALLVWVILRRLGVGWPWFVAAVFALHPVNVESVAWIAERKNVFSGVFYLLSAWFYIGYAGLGAGARLDGSAGDGEHVDANVDADAGRRGRGSYLALSIVLFAAALLGKTATASLPVVLLIGTWWKRGRIGRKDVLSTLPFFVLGLALGLMTLRVETGLLDESSDAWGLSFVQRMLLAGRALWFYATKLTWPFGLSFDYGRWSIDPGAWWQVLPSIAALLAAVVLWRLRDRLGRGPLVAYLYFVVTLLPTLGFLNVFYFRYSYVADHFQYLASIGWLALLVATVGLAAKRWAPSAKGHIGVEADRTGTARGRDAVLAAAAVLVVLAGLTWNRCRDFHDMESLCRSILRTNEDSWLAHNNLGKELMGRGELDPALGHLRRAEALEPRFVETQLNLAIALMNVGRLDQARAHAERAIELKPRNMYGYNALGEVLIRAHEPAEAIAPLRRALAIDGNYPKAQISLGTALAQTGRPLEAADWLGRALAQDPTNVTARANLALVLAQLGRHDEAAAQLEQALRDDPDNPVIRQNLLRMKELRDP